MAVKEVHVRGGSLEDVDGKLMTWRKQGFATPEQLKAARVRIKALNDQLREVYAAAGVEKRVNQPDRDLLAKWMGEMGMSMDMVLLAVTYARGSGAPMLMCDRILSSWQQAGIRDVQAAKAEHDAHVRGGAKPAQVRAQRETLQRHAYSQEDYRRMMIDLDEEEN